MLFYLDNWLSASPDSPGARLAGQNNRRRGLNENYARELMELHTVGVDGGYTQKDVVEVARCFTGWTIRQPQQRGEFRVRAAHSRPRRKNRPGHAHPGRRRHRRWHESNRPAGAPSGYGAGLSLTKLARRFIADNPPASMIDKAGADISPKRRRYAAPCSQRSSIRRNSSSPEDYRAKVKKPLGVCRQRAPRGHRRGNQGHAINYCATRAHGRAAVLGPAADRLSRCRRSWISPDMLLTRMNFAPIWSAIASTAQRVHARRAERQRSVPAT